jgi:RHS repeat-associated protein
VVVTKYYFFGGQRIARRSSVDGYKPFYLHADHLLSTVLESNEAGAATADHKYHAYGTQRDSGKVAGEQRFTGQREDDTGLVYMNARYYDPQLGQFISPDTLVPQPALLVDYNRYLYSRGNPIKYSDPSGHCATGANGEPDENDGKCWATARTIYLMWDQTNYWQNMWPAGKDHFINNIAPLPVGAEFFENRMLEYFNSSKYQDYRATHPMSGSSSSSELDLGDYTSINATYFVLDGSLTVDDFGNVFLRIGPALGVPGISLVRGQVSMISDPNANLMDVTTGKATATDIDQLGLTREEKSQLMKQLMVGESQSVSIGGRYATMGVAQGKGVGAIEIGVTGKAFSFVIAPRSYTLRLR